MTLKELRKQKGLTQKKCAELIGIPMRTFQRYENDDNGQNTIKYKYIFEKLEQYGFIDENHGVLSVREIKEICAEVLGDYDVKYCYLFGSYAKGKATEKSDVDLLISTSATGMLFFDLVEVLREKLKKKVDALNQGQINDNLELLNEILKDGIKIYG